jgi:5-methylcytosine-specific restriction endonuclease McrA
MNAERWLQKHDPKRRRKRHDEPRSPKWFSRQGQWKFLLKYHYDRKPKGFDLTGAFLNRLWLAQEGKCAYCACELGPIENHVLEHMTPLSRGGLSTQDNVCFACHDCNVRKYTQTVEEFLGPCRSPGSGTGGGEASLSGDASTEARMVRGGVRTLRRRRRTK